MKKQAKSVEARSSGACSVTDSFKLFKSAMKVIWNLHIKQARTELSGKVSRCIWMYSHLEKDSKSKHKAYKKYGEKKIDQQIKGHLRG